MTVNISKRVLVTGGAGYIGSHTCVALLAAGFEPIIVDNLSNADGRVIDRLETVTGHRPIFCHSDIRDCAAIRRIISTYPVCAAIHFAGVKSLEESVREPLKYYDHNVSGTVKLLECLQQQGIKKFLFSSSATVYGIPDQVPINEESPLRPVGPYGCSKAMIESILGDLKVSDPSWRIGILRYFNPAGAHRSGLIGEDPRGIPANLVPFITQVAAGRHQYLNVFGDNYATPDGTCIRDFIHVMDLAEGHVAALRYILEHEAQLTVNLGTGRGYSVMEVLQAFRRVSGQPIPHKIAPRRACGDAPVCYASVARAKQLLNWRTTSSIEDICRDAWRWQVNNPDGYREPANDSLQMLSF